MRRGGDQRTSLLISLYPYSSVFMPLIQAFGPALMLEGQPLAAQLFEQSCTQWPAPIPGRNLQFPVAPVPITGRICPDGCLPDKPVKLVMQAQYSGLMRTASSAGHESFHNLLRASSTGLPFDGSSHNTITKPPCGTRCDDASCLQV